MIFAPSVAQARCSLFSLSKSSPWIPVGQEVSSRWEPNLELLEAPWGHPKLGWLGLKGPPLEAPSAQGIFYLVDVDLHLRAPTCSEV